jgi:MOSC domain-containing protein YiiM
MKVISVDVGLPRTVRWKGKAVSTGIFKTPESGRMHLRTLNFAGARQVDLSAHGGPEKVAHGYRAKHHAYWHGVQTHCRIRGQSPHLRSGCDALRNPRDRLDASPAVP